MQALFRITREVFLEKAARSVRFGNISFVFLRGAPKRPLPPQRKGASVRPDGRDLAYASVFHSTQRRNITAASARVVFFLGLRYRAPFSSEPLMTPDWVAQSIASTT